MRRRLPAGLQLTSARHAVTLATEDHVAQHCSTTCLIVVPVDLGLDVRALLACVQELLRELDSVLEIVRTAAPFPRVGPTATSARILLVLVTEDIFGVQLSFRMIRWIAAAGKDSSLAACTSHCVGDTSRRDGIGECTFTVS